jgi:ribosomal protein L29
MANHPIVLTVGAREAVREMGESEQQQLARALRRELFDRGGTVVAPHALIKPAGSPVGYPARALSSGHVAVFRPMEDEELKEFARERHESVASSGVVVHDILSGSAFRSGSVVPINDQEL